MPELDVNTVALAQREREEAEWEKTMPKIGVCIHCYEPILGSTEAYEGDDYVETEDGPVHWDCWDDYGRSIVKHG